MSVEEKKEFYVTLRNFDETLAPIVASTELTKDYLMLNRIILKLLDETQIEEIADEDGNVTGTYTKFHKDLKWFMKLKLEYEKQIAKFNLQAGIKAKENDLNEIKILLENSDALTPEEKRELGKKLLRKRNMKIIVADNAQVMDVDD